MFMAFTGKLNLARDTKISNFVVCSKMNVHSENNDRACNNTFTSNVNGLFVCGNLDTNNREETGITIYLFRDELEAPIYTSPVNLRLSKGEFCHGMVLPAHDKKGSYIVKVFYFRRILASTTFDIR
jgi:hypothetical protein